jgi:hypothetical protein
MQHNQHTIAYVESIQFLAFTLLPFCKPALYTFPTIQLHIIIVKSFANLLREVGGNISDRLFCLHWGIVSIL